MGDPGKTGGYVLLLILIAAAAAAAFFAPAVTGEQEIEERFLRCSRVTGFR